MAYNDVCLGDTTQAPHPPPEPPPSLCPFADVPTTFSTVEVVPCSASPDPSPLYLLDAVPCTASQIDAPFLMLDIHNPHATYDTCLDLWCNHASLLLDAICYTNHPHMAPPGPIFDPTIPIQSADLNHFPFLTLAPHKSPLVSTHPSLFGDTFSSLRQDCLIPLLQCMQAIGLACSLANGSTSVCVTNNPTLLVDNIEIDPVPLVVAFSYHDKCTVP
jgi:hypothetical protein